MPTPVDALDNIPLIKSPSFWVPKPVQLPPDIHPLPDDVTAYFVYPHSLEAQALPSLHANLATLRASHAARLTTLADLADAKERARKALLNRLAPGWSEGGGGVMEPSRKAGPGTTSGAGAAVGVSPGTAAGGDGVELEGLVVSRKSLEETRAELLAETGEGGMERDAMVDLVDGLMALETAGGKAAGA